MTRQRDKPGVSTEERSLFRRMVGDATHPLPHSGHRRRARPMPSTRPLITEADEAEVMMQLLDDGPEELETGDELTYRRAGVQLAVMRRLKRGHYRCQAELDLHGMVVATARRALAEFLHTACARQYRCVRIIHGKGLRSGNRGPVLKNKIAHWLRQRQEVLAYSSARHTDGGTGAVYVLLRRT